MPTVGVEIQGFMTFIVINAERMINLLRARDDALAAVPSPARGEKRPGVLSPTETG